MIHASTKGDSMEHDYSTLVCDETRDMSATLHTLSDEQWDAPSLCEGWRVRDVIGHICVGSTMSLVSFPFRLARYRFNVPRGSHEMSVEFGSTHSPAQILEAFDRYAAVADHPGGLARVIKTHERFTDHLIHHQDIRRPLGLARKIPADRLVAALDALPRIGGFLKSNRNAAGLRFVATDIDWSWGDGPEVRGPAESLVLAISGRPVGLDALEGDGLPTLVARIKPAA
jgi:uncharacterized protein (TIGR03083 family)